MKQIALLRHAKSDWGDSEIDDIKRPLAQKGHKDAPLMGHWIKDQFQPELALVSPALRAVQTYEHLGLSIPHEIENSLYPTQAGNLMRLLQRQPSGLSAVIIVGHNPGISSAVTTFLNEVGDDPKLEDMPTCSCALLKFDVDDWKDLDFGQARLLAFMTPKKLQN